MSIDARPNPIPQPADMPSPSVGGMAAAGSLLIAAVCAALLLGGVLGWLYAHKTIAIECDRLGGFYVGPSVFQCARTTSLPLRGSSKFEGLL